MKAHENAKSNSLGGGASRHKRRNANDQSTIRPKRSRVSEISSGESVTEPLEADELQQRLSTAAGADTSQMVEEESHPTVAEPESDSDGSDSDTQRLSSRSVSVMTSALYIILC